jgi:Ca2+-binding RTX toxin-like protein
MQAAHVVGADLLLGGGRRQVRDGVPGGAAAERADEGAASVVGAVRHQHPFSAPAPCSRRERARRLGIDTVDYSGRLAGHAVVVSPRLLGDGHADGNALANIIWGGARNDTIGGGNGNDTLYGETGNDSLCGYDGAGAGAIGTDDDSLIGGAGTDTFEGDGGNDFIEASHGVADTLIDCGSGNSPLLVCDAAGARAARWRSRARARRRPSQIRSVRQSDGSSAPSSASRRRRKRRSHSFCASACARR